MTEHIPPAESAAASRPYDGLTPDCVLDALATVGFVGDGRLLALNSFENRVYQAWRDEGPPIVAKFYRPRRWSDAAIAEEHDFVAELAADELPAVAPEAASNGQTLHAHAGFRFAVYPRRGGRPPELDDPAVLEWIGRLLGRCHNVGARSDFRDRPALDLATFGREPSRYLLGHDFLPADLRTPYAAIVDLALTGIERCFERAGDLRLLRLHGDCHAGNILWTDAGPHFVDFDDSRSGPAVQDLWMLASGTPAEMARQLGHVLDGYEIFRSFDRRELLIVEALRTLRLIHYAGWIARRWDDPAFPAAFPWFGTPRYWQDRILELREQVAAMDEPALPV